jgi:adenylate cyclase class 2
MPLERELKFLGADFDVLREDLQQAGANFQARYFERNAVLDDGQGSFKARGMLLRLRQGASCTLTLKLPAQAESVGDFKELEERETTVGDFDAMLSILDGLGLRPAFWYEKVRETWRLGQVEIDLDELPFGRFVEIEGPAEAIEKAAQSLGISNLATSTASYHALNSEHRRQLGLPLKDGFSFKPGEAQRILLEGRI